MTATALDLVHDMYRAVSAGDRTWFDTNADAGPLVHVLPGASWTDGEGLRKNLHRGLDEMAVRWTPGEAVSMEVADMACVVDRPTVRFDDDSTLDARVTVVLVRRGDRWLVAHLHLSIPEL